VIFWQGAGITLRQADPLDPEDLAPRLREWDIIEVLATGSDPLTSLTRPFWNNCGSYTYSFEIDGVLAGMCGFAPLTIREASIWLLGSKEIDEAGIRFLPASRAWLNGIPPYPPVLFNYVPERRTQSIRWLRWLGFDIGEEILHLRGVRFRRFALDRRAVR